jgi:hypothetical protein
MQDFQLNDGKAINVEDFVMNLLYNTLNWSANSIYVLFQTWIE